MAGPGDRADVAAEVLTTFGLLAALFLGSLWVALAVVDHSPVGVVVRFLVSLAAACYYLVLHRIARGPPALPGAR